MARVAPCAAGFSSPLAVRLRRLARSGAGGPVAGLLLRPVRQGPDVGLERPIAAGRVVQSLAERGAVPVGALAAGSARPFRRGRLQPARGSGLRRRAAQVARGLGANKTT